MTTLFPGLTVSPIGFGGMALTDVYGGIDDASAEKTLHEVIDMGISFIDTADVYGVTRPDATGPAGTNEELIGRVLRTRRDEVQLATKFGIVGFFNDGARIRGDRDYVHAACDASLKRLGVDVIDLYYLHRRQLDLPIEETVAAMSELVDAGKVRFLGLSEVTAAELQAANNVHPIAAVQSEWSLWSRDVENHVVPAAAKLGVGFVPYSPLGRGFLAGSVTKEKIPGTVLANHPRFTDHFAANQAIITLVKEVAAEVNATPAQISLAWLRHQGERFGLPVVPIPGSRKAARMQENLASCDLTLDADHLNRLNQVSEQVHGSRDFTFTPPEWISSDRE